MLTKYLAIHKIPFTESFIQRSHVLLPTNKLYDLITV